MISNSLGARAFVAYISGDLRTAGALSDRALELALYDSTPTFLAHRYMLEILVHQQSGDVAGAEKQFTTGMPFFDDPAFKNDLRGSFTLALGRAARNGWILGRAELARERDAAMRAAVNEANPHDIVWAGFHSATLHLLMREYESVDAWAPMVLELCEKYHLPNDAAFVRCALGAARAHLGRAADGIDLIREGIAALLKIGNRISTPYWIASQAEAQSIQGAQADALLTIENALEFNPAELVNRPDSLRMRGEIHLRLGRPELGEADFRESIALAQNMGAKFWELRSTMSLVRLLASQGRRDEARAMLAEIYGWFTEGFDTADLKDAKALLDELSR